MWISPAVNCFPSTYLLETATPYGPVVLMKACVTRVPFRFAFPMAFLLAQQMWDASTATPVGWLAPVIKRCLTPEPLRFARPIAL